MLQHPCRELKFMKVITYHDDDLKNEDNLKIGDDLKNKDNLKMKTTKKIKTILKMKAISKMKTTLVLKCQFSPHPSA